MKTISILGLTLALHLPLSAAEIPKPAIDYQGFAKLTRKVEPLRAQRRLSEEDFLKMAAEPGTVVLDARSTDKFEGLHVKGAIHLAFTDFAAENLSKLIPDKGTRILIYCNNNFRNEPLYFIGKSAPVSLNIQTFINLHAYGYTNVYELGPLLDMKTTRIPFEGTAVQK